MGDIGSKALPKRRRLEVGDRVEIADAKPDELDVGTVVGFTFNGVRVHWSEADEIYTEDQADLRLVTADNAAVRK